MQAALAQSWEGDVKVMQMPARWLAKHIGSNPVFHWAGLIYRQVCQHARRHRHAISA
jgi:hypothetical protein